MARYRALVPTTRECSLLAVLLFALLLVSAPSDSVRESRLVLEKVVRKYDSAFRSSQDPRLPSPDSEHWRTRVSWSPDQPVPSTTVITHAPGWTIFDNLFLLNGTVFVVTEYPGAIPDRNLITSTGVDIVKDAKGPAARLPTERELRVISPTEAREIFGTSADLIDGTTWILNDPPQFIAHYYHWTAELFFGFWRTYSSLDTYLSADGSSTLPALRRIWFPHTDSDQWRDRASMNQLVLRGVFPSITAEYSSDWQERAAMMRPVVFDRVIFTDRSAACFSKHCKHTGRIIAEALHFPGSVHWWTFIRGVITKLGGVDMDLDPKSNPVITYISRQEWSRRKLIEEDHERLVEALYDLRDHSRVEVNVVNTDELTQVELLRLAARTTILMGVHGDGLTSVLWMSPNPKTTVIEFFYPNGFTRDYEYIAQAFGIAYYGIWDDEVFSGPKVPPIKYPQGFHGNNIPLDSETVINLCVKRLEIQR